MNKIRFEEVVENPYLLAELRRAASMTQKKAAKHFKMSQSLLSRIETGKQAINCRRLKEMYDYYINLINKQYSPISLYITPIEQVKYVTPEDRIKKATDLMKNFSLSQLPVKEGEKFVGSVDENSVINVNKRERVAKVMKEPFPILPSTMPKQNVGDFFKRNKEIYAVFIMDKRGNIIGLVSRFDLYAKE